MPNRAQDLAGQLPRRKGDRPDASMASSPLSRREVEVLTWVAEGKSSTVIGTLLGISARTVNFHVENAIHKLGAANRSQAAVFAAQQGLITIRRHVSARRGRPA